MGIKRKFTGISDLGYGGSTFSIRHYSKDKIRIEIEHANWGDQSLDVIWVDVATAVKISKEIKREIALAKSKEQL